MGDGSRRKEEDSDEGEYEMDDLNESLRESRESRFNLVANQVSLLRRNPNRESVLSGFRHFSRNLVFHPDNRFKFNFPNNFFSFFNCIDIIKRLNKQQDFRIESCFQASEFFEL